MPSVTEIKARLAEHAEAVCKAYLPNGRRAGNYWIVGDIYGSKGRSLYIRLRGPFDRIGKWTDAATGEHGDLLDIIRNSAGLSSFPDTLFEARSFLSLPHPPQGIQTDNPYQCTDRPAKARRLFHAGHSLAGTIAEQYLRGRAIGGRLSADTLRFHSKCYYRRNEDASLRILPAMLAAITDLSGTITGVHRTWLRTDGSDKADIEDPRRVMGHLIGHAVRFGRAHDVLIAGEGIETILSIRSVLPAIPAAAALTANHLSLLLLPPTLQRLYVAQDNDPPGISATRTLIARAKAAGAEAWPLIPIHDDWNSDLCSLGPDITLANLRGFLHPSDLHPIQGLFEVPA